MGILYFSIVYVVCLFICLGCHILIDNIKWRAFVNRTCIIEDKKIIVSINGDEYKINKDTCVQELETIIQEKYKKK